MPTVITQGAASAKGYGFGARSVAANFIEDVFSTYLYTGTGASQTISNGVDLSTKGGMVWIKSRSAATNNFLFDTSRGTTKEINSNTTDAEATLANSLTAFNTDGFTVNSATGIGVNAATYVSWTFRKQAKFFDVVTYTGNGVAGRTVAHNLGSAPGCMIVKRTDGATNWRVYHRSLGATQYLDLDETVAAGTATTIWNDTAPTATVFSVGTNSGVNANGGTYVAYLFAHDAGGFGASGSDNVISCGSFTTDGSGNATVSLGYEPQWLLVKVSSGATGDWRLIDNMRGFSLSSEAFLRPNSSAAETVLSTPFYTPTSTGFKLTGSNPSITFIYIAIRRGPMKTPTSGTSVFQPNFGSDVTTYTTNFPLDMGWDGYTLGGATDFMAVGARLLGQASLATASTAAESTAIIPADFWISNTSYRFNAYGNDCATYAFRRAPGFFDVVCYTGTGASATLNHNLGVAPNMVIIKGRSVVSNWETYLSSLGGTGGNGLAINDSGAKSGTPPVSSATATTFTLNNGVSTSSGQTYVAYLFATLSGVSKVGSYTGSGTTKQIDCGFTGGARFVLIKRTDSTGDWYLWDSARGIVAGNDPYLRLNSSSAQVTGTDYVDTYSAGFEISSTAPAAINANGGSFIFLAIA